MLGQKFGRLVVLARERQDKERRWLWKCQCDCGQITITAGTKLRSGHTQSCGCLQRERSILAHSGRRSPYGKAFGAAATNRLFRQYENNAKRRGLLFVLSPDIFRDLLRSNCHYCGSPPAQLAMDPHFLRSGFILYNGIDRVDNGKGYIPDNCVPCCHICNQAKSDRSIKDFLAWIERIKAYKP